MAEQGSESLGGLSGLTRKARDMAYARNPLNDNELNLSSMERKQGVVAQPEQAAVTEATTGRGDAARQQRNAQDYQQQQAQQLQASMGTLGLQLQAAVNDFTSGQGASSASAVMGEAGAPYYDKKTGDWITPSAGEQVGAGLTDVLAEKQAQQEVLRAKAGELFDASGQPKRFEDVLAKFADQNQDGVIDENEEAFLQKAFGIVNALRRLQELNPSSPEADALRMQLSLEDRDGMVSGLLAAMERYDRVTGLKVSGAEAEEYQLQDLLSMGEEELKTELEKAVTGSSGLFGGDFETSLKRQVDESARQYRAAAKEDVAVMNEMTDEAEAWLREYEDAFEGQRDALNKMFGGAAAGVIADLDALKAESAGQDTEWIDRAKQWFVDMQNTVNSGNTDFATVVQQMLASDSGLAPEARTMLKRWLGQTIGHDVVEKGEIARVIERISETGLLQTVDENGNVVEKPVTSGQKMQIAHIMADENMTSAEKSEAIQAVIQQASGQMGQDLQADSKYISELIQDGDMQTALDSFRKAMVGSLKDFKGSLVSSFYKQVKDSGINPQDVGPEAFTGKVAEAVKLQSDSIKLAAEEATKAAQGVKDTAERDIKEVRAMLKNARALVTKGAQQVKANIQAAIDAGVERYQAQMEEVLRGYPGSPVGDIKAKARAYSFIQLLRAGRSTNNALYLSVKRQHPSIDKYLDNPKLAMGLSAADMQGVNVLNQWANSVDATGIFNQSETGRSLLDVPKGYIYRLNDANNSATNAYNSATKLLTQIDSTAKVALANLNKTLSVSPTDLFNAAKSGETVDFTNFDTSGTVKQLAGLGGKAQFTEDATNLDVDVSGVGKEFVDPGDTGGLQRYVAPPPPAPEPVARDVNKNVEKGGTPGKGTQDTYTWHANDGTTGRITVPKGADPKVVMAQRYPGLDTGTVGFESVSPLTQLGESFSRGWENVKGAFSKEGGGGERETPTRETPTREAPEPRRTSKDRGGDR